MQRELDREASSRRLQTLRDGKTAEHAPIAARCFGRKARISFGLNSTHISTTWDAKKKEKNNSYTAKSYLSFFQNSWRHLSVFVGKIVLHLFFGINSIYFGKHPKT